jgi:NAD(P)-dependent dehydrogenase (short-subunit alcohol dehydrogenase family)
VTGGGRGIGRAHAIELASHGASVVVNDVPDAAGRAAAGATVAAVEAVGGEAVVVVADVSTWSGAEELIGTAVARFGRLDVLVNNAGIVRHGSVVDATEADWDDTLRINLKGHIGASRFAAAHWQGRADSGERPYGGIVNTTSGAAFIGLPGFASYDTAKAGVIGLTLVMAQALAPIGVTVNAIAPAARTRMTSHLVQMATPGPATGCASARSSTLPSPSATGRRASPPSSRSKGRATTCPHTPATSTS